MVYTARFKCNVVHLTSVTKDYARGTATIRALSEVTLYVSEGEFCALRGPSGCGKSTLLALIAGFDTPSSGNIAIAGRPTASLTDRQWTQLRRDVIGMVFQAFHLIPGLTAAENIALPLLLKGESGPRVSDRVTESLEWVGLTHRKGHKPGELSGGEQQRIALARALVHRPRLVLADEPTGNLDSKSGAGVIALLRSLPAHSGQTIIMATHSLHAAQQADRLYAMADGRITPS